MVLCDSECLGSVVGMKNLTEMMRSDDRMDGGWG